MSSVDNQIIHVCRTAYGAYLQTCLKLGLPFKLIANTTLNERLGIQAGVAPSAAEIPKMKYLVFGNRGHKTITADDGSDEIIPVPHDASHAGLYGLIPICIRDLDNDLPAELRAQYGLRRIAPHNGKNKIEYYALRMDYSNVNVTLQSLTTVEGDTKTDVFVPDSTNLNPTPPVIQNSGVVLGSDKNISASAIITVRLTENQITEMINAHRVRTGSTRSPVLSEIGFVSAVDRNVSVTNGGAGSFMFNEMIAAQLNVIISTHHAIGYSSNGATLAFDVGNTEPLLGTDGRNGVTWLS